MPLNRKKFQRLEERVVETLEGRSPLMEVPYYLCVYHPKDELEILENFPNMVLRLKNKGFSAETIKLSDLMLDILSNSGLLSSEIIQNEEEMREELERDLRRVLSKELVEVLKEKLKDMDVNHCAVLLRYGALWPFVHISHIFLSIEGSVKCTLVVPYPSAIGEGFPLNKKSKGIIDYYRAEVVDLR
jgi:hypothetical protein